MSKAARWYERAACRREPDLWLSPSQHSSVLTLAAHICRAHCPVLQECARDRYEHNPLHAVSVLQAGVHVTSYAPGKLTRPRDMRCGHRCERWRNHP